MLRQSLDATVARLRARQTRWCDAISTYDVWWVMKFCLALHFVALALPLIDHENIQDVDDRIEI